MKFLKFKDANGCHITLNISSIIYYYPTYKFGKDKKAVQIVVEENKIRTIFDIAMSEEDFDQHFMDLLCIGEVDAFSDISRGE